MSFDAPAKILLVDDHAENLMVLEETLGKLGQPLVKASSGQEALRHLLYEDFAVILLDVQMPDMDGLETAKLIRQRARSRLTPIIFLTAFSTSDEAVTQGYEFGAVDYLFKPIKPAILLAKVKVFLELYQKNQAIEHQAAQLRQSEERFRLLSTCSPVGIFLTDTNGHCTYANPAFQTICGFRGGANFQENWLRCIHPNDRDAVLADWSAYTQSSRTLSREFRFYPFNDGLRWLHLRCAPLRSENGTLLGQVGTVEDITGRKQIEAAQEQIIREQAAREEAETANRLKDEFLAVLSHELRTPLNAIVGWSKMLLNSSSMSEAARQHALEIIHRNAIAQTKLVEDILDISFIIQGKLALRLNSVDITVLIQDTVNSLQPSAEAKNIQLDLKLESHQAEVLGDVNRLQQVLQNLISNAIKFTPDSGQVTIRSYWTDQAVQIEVSDTGIGITPDFLPYVFDRFRQQDSSHTRKHGGMGLGLAIAKNLIDLHGGTIMVESEGKGATFTLQLPLAQSSALSSEELQCKAEQPTTF